MCKELFVLALLATFVIVATAQSSFAGSDWQKEKGTYAVLKTSMGKIVCKLYSDKAPETVENFISLAEGTNKKATTKSGKFYDGTIFHRIIPNFMIQGGDPRGNGTGGPGYSFKDEFDTSLKFDKPGLLAMANAGPNTNGSQFFITHVPTPWLNNKHTIFGEVVEGMDVVMKMADVKKGFGDKPVTDIVLETVEIVKNK